MKTTLVPTVLIVAVMISASPLGAATDRSESSFRPTFSAGPAVIAVSKPYKGVDTDFYIVPLFFYESRRFYFRGSSLGYILIGHDGDTRRWSVDAVAQWRFDSYDSDDSDRLDGMADRKMSVDAGLALNAEAAWGQASLSLLTDTLSRHRGRELRFSYARPFVLRRLRFTPSAGLSWQSESLVDYYYGVRATEARPGRPAYRPGDATNLFAAVKIEYELAEDWVAFSAMQYERLHKRILDSPIVDQPYTVSAVAGLLYKF